MYIYIKWTFIYQMIVGMIDAFRKIYTLEGVSGLYRGFWISSIQIVSGVFYVSTYEGVRHILKTDPATAKLDSRIKAFIGGGAASLVGQTIVVPFDVLSQHLMVLGVSFKHGKLSVDKVIKQVKKLHLIFHIRFFNLIFIADGYESTRNISVSWKV